MTTKTCRKCSESKPYADFPKGKDANGLYYICKSCTVARTQLRYQTMDKLNRWVDHTLSDVRLRAARKGVAFDLTKDTFHKMYHDQQGKCRYCGVEFCLTNTKHARRDSPSTDRIVPAEGYVCNNVVLCCHRCNAIKQDATPEELQTIATAVASLFFERGLTTITGSIPSRTA